MPSGTALEQRTVCLYLETVRSSVHDLRAEVDLNHSALEGISHLDDHSTPIIFLRVTLLPTDSWVFYVICGSSDSLS